MDYETAGVSFSRARQWTSWVADLARATARPEVLGGIGGFAGFFAMPKGYQEPVLVAAADGVGTKIELAASLGRHRVLGVDLVAMNVNDLLAHGAEPLFFLDYLACGRLDLSSAQGVLEGVKEACLEAGCALLGGETAEMPGFYEEGRFDLAGFALGVAERSKIWPQGVSPGDRIVGLASSGPHANGFSLIRRVLAQGPAPLDPSLPEKLLAPTRIYVQPVLEAKKSFSIKAAAHITGGGLVENVPRVLPSGLGASFREESWPCPDVFASIAEMGGVPQEEMRRVFNLGLGFVTVVAPEEAQALASFFTEQGFPAYVVGEVVSGQGVFFS